LRPSEENQSGSVIPHTEPLCFHEKFTRIAAGSLEKNNGSREEDEGMKRRVNRQNQAIVWLSVTLGLSSLLTYKTQTFKIYSSSEQAGREAVIYVNKLRRQYGKSEISFDTRAFALASARAKDMSAHRYLDHTNPKTGTCPYNMKGGYGFREDEYLAENASGYPDYAEGFFTKRVEAPISEVVDGWLYSRGHRYNLLYEGHTAGAVACDKDKCTFLGLNNQRFGARCITAAEGQAYWRTNPIQPGEVTLPDRPKPTRPW
jgi:uncharacterized protein YkwD